MRQKIRIIYQVHFKNGAVKHYRDKTTKISTIERSLKRFLNYNNVSYVKAYKCYNDEQISNYNKIAYAGRRKDNNSVYLNINA